MSWRKVFSTDIVETEFVLVTRCGILEMSLSSNALLDGAGDALLRRRVLGRAHMRDFARAQTRDFTMKMTQSGMKMLPARCSCKV